MTKKQQSIVVLSYGHTLIKRKLTGYKALSKKKINKLIHQSKQNVTLDFWADSTQSVHQHELTSVLSILFPTLQRVEIFGIEELLAEQK